MYITRNSEEGIAPFLTMFRDFDACVCIYTYVIVCVSLCMYTILTSICIIYVVETYMVYHSSFGEIKPHAPQHFNNLQSFDKGMHRRSPTWHDACPCTCTDRRSSRLAHVFRKQSAHAMFLSTYTQSLIRLTSTTWSTTSANPFQSQQLQW